MPYPPDTATVIAARAGDQQALDRLVAGYLPLVYNIVGRALGGHADVDDLVQETMLRVLHHLPGLRDPASFRAWLVTIALRQVRDRHRSGRAAPVPVDGAQDWHDPGADFADLTIARLELSGQRREVAEATRWLDSDDRELLSLWWLEAAGELTRDEVVAAVGGNGAHVAVRVQRMKAQLETARAVVRALRAQPVCPDLLLLTSAWDGRPGSRWRKRLARHTRECGACAAAWTGLVAAERLLAGLALVPLPVPLLAYSAALGGAGTTTTAGTSTAGTTTAGTTTAGAATAGTTSTAGATAATVVRGAHRLTRWPGALTGKPLVAAVATTVVLAGAAVGGLLLRPGPEQPRLPTAAAAATPSATAAPASAAGPTPSPSPRPAATAAASVAPSPQPAPQPPPPAPPATRTAKKGVATWEFGGVTEALRDVGAAWYYNWSPSDDTMPAPPGVEFVPMIWGEGSVTDATLAKAQQEGRVLLGFNEPDLGEQADMSVERALELWPRLEATGMRLGSPAVAFGADIPGGWLDRFLTGARQRGLRVDFITLHWYGSDFSDAAVGHLRGYLEATYQRHRLPIWVTEYGLINFSGSPRYPTDDQQVAFVRGSTAMMESLPYVERYAWFGLPAEGAGTGLYRDGRTPTPAGVAYRAAGSG